MSWLDQPLPLSAGVGSAWEPVVASPTPPPDRDWIGRLLGFAPWILLIIVVAWFCLRPTPIPDDQRIRVDKLRVLVIEDSGDRSRLPTEQLAIFNSVQVREAIANLDGQLLVLDSDDDTAKLDATWQELRRRVDLRPPCVVMAAKNKALHIALPPSVDSFVSRLERFAK